MSGFDHMFVRFGLHDDTYVRFWPHMRKFVRLGHTTACFLDRVRVTTGHKLLSGTFPQTYQV